MLRQFLTSNNMHCVQQLHLFLFHLFIAKKWMFVHFSDTPNWKWELYVLGAAVYVYLSFQSTRPSVVHIFVIVHFSTVVWLFKARQWTTTLLQIPNEKHGCCSLSVNSHVYGGMWNSREATNRALKFCKMYVLQIGIKQFGGRAGKTGLLW